MIDIPHSQDSRLRRMLGMGNPGSPASFPPPYKRMVALSSDVEFTSWDTQLALIRRFERAGLETSFSYWLFRGPDPTWHVFNDDLQWTPEGRRALPLLRAGALDAHHAYGVRLQGAPVTRENIRRGLGLLQDEGVSSPIFSNHGSKAEIQNVGGAWSDDHPYANYGQGDLPDSDAYHLDLTLAHGSRFFWTDIDIAEQVNLSLDETNPFLETQLSRDGNRIIRFKRSAAGGDPSQTGLAAQIRAVLESTAPGFSVVYTHLGLSRCEQPFTPATPPHFTPQGSEALDELAQAQARGEILVTSLARLLDFALLMRARPWRLHNIGPLLVASFSKILEYEGVKMPLSWETLEGWAIPLGPGRTPYAVLGGQVRRMSVFEAGGVRWAGFPWKRRSYEKPLEEASGG